MAFGYGSGSSLNKTANDNSRRKPIKSLKENSNETVYSTRTLISEDNQISKEELLQMREKMEARNKRVLKTTIIAIIPLFFMVIIAVIIFIS